MNLGAWRESRQVVLKLDGLDLQFRRLSLLDMATSGNVPAPLTGLVQEMIDGKASIGANLAEWREYAPVIDQMVIAASVGEPRVTAEPGPESVGVGEIPFELKVRVFNALTSSGELRPFRPEPEAAVEAA